MMEMSIDEAIKQLTTYSIPCGKYKNAYDMAIDTMRKYQKIQETMNRWYEDKTWEFDTSYLCEIGEILEDGDVD